MNSTLQQFNGRLKEIGAVKIKSYEDENSTYNTYQIGSTKQVIVQEFPSGCFEVFYASGTNDLNEEIFQLQFFAKHKKEFTVLSQVEKVLTNYFFNEATTSMTVADGIKHASRLMLKMKSKILGKTSPTLPVIQLQAIMNLFHADNHINKRTVIHEAFADCHEELIKQLDEKFEKEANCSVIEFIKILDINLRGQFLMYIMENHEGTSFKTIEQDYLHDLY